MKNHDKMKNYDTHFEAAIVGIGIITMALTSIVLAGIKLVEYIAKQLNKNERYYYYRIPY